MQRLKKTELFALVSVGIGLITGLVIWGWTGSVLFAVLVGLVIAGSINQAALKQSALANIVDNKP